jgi:hypothetical protein
MYKFEGWLKGSRLEDLTISISNIKNRIKYEIHA